VRTIIKRLPSYI